MCHFIPALTGLKSRRCLRLLAEDGAVEVRGEIRLPFCSSSSSSLAAGAPSCAARACPSWCLPATPEQRSPAPAKFAGYASGAGAPSGIRRLPPAGRWEPLCGASRDSAQRGGPFDMQSVAARGSEAEERCHSGAWRRGHRKVRRQRGQSHESPDHATVSTGSTCPPE